MLDEGSPLPLSIFPFYSTWSVCPLCGEPGQGPSPRSAGLLPGFPDAAPDGLAPFFTGLLPAAFLELMLLNWREIMEVGSGRGEETPQGEIHGDRASWNRCQNGHLPASIMGSSNQDCN